MEHYPDPYDDETEARSRRESWKILGALILVAVLAACGLDLWAWLCGK